MRKLEIKIFWYSVILVFFLSSCHKYYFRDNYNTANQLIHANQNPNNKTFIKAHLKNGNVCIFQENWSIDTLNSKLNGIGTVYDFNRFKIYAGAIQIPLDSVAIYETNKKLDRTETDRMAMITILSALNLAVGFICITVPKACFGSCPTFYTAGHTLLQSA